LRIYNMNWHQLKISMPSPKLHFVILLLVPLLISNNYAFALTITGSQQNDNFVGTTSSDTMLGLNGNDNITALEGDN
jgi:hypothetical protein